MPMPVYSFKDSTVRLFPSCREWAVRKRTVGECVRFDVIGWRPCSSNGHGSGPLEEHLLMCSELPGSASEYGRIHDRSEGGGSAEGCYARKRPPSHSVCSGISSEIAGSTLRQQHFMAFLSPVSTQRCNELHCAFRQKA